MTLPPVSVIVVSRHRTAELLRCIEGLCQQDHLRMEVIVVADPAAAGAVRALGLQIKLAVFDKANISAARNAGLVLAAGEVVAFIDDDAVAEPTWATRLAQPFVDPDVVQAGGFVRGRNGISYQWQAMEVDATGQDHRLAVPGGVSLYPGSALRAVKTQGTNCAFRRADLLAVGGFDPAYRFYLDDADVNLRLAARGGLTAVVAGAEVQHGFAASALRRADRVPLSLHEIGASAAVFLRRHAPERIEAGLRALETGQRMRLVQFMVTGGIEPRDVARLLAGLRAGIAEGRERPLLPQGPLHAAAAPFLPLPGLGAREGVLLAGWPWQRRALVRAAQKARAAGRIVSVLILSPGRRPHRQRFEHGGVWWQDGGVHGPSDRRDPVMRVWRYRTRVAREAARLAVLRPVCGDCRSGPVGMRVVSPISTEPPKIHSPF